MGNSKETDETEFHPLDPTLGYQQRDSNVCCFISLESSLTDSKEVVATRATAGKMEESSNCQSKGYSDSNIFAKAIMIDNEINKGDQRLHYKI